MAAAELEVLIYDALQKALAPDGIPSQMIAEALDGINELLDKAASYLFPGRYLHLTGELGIVLQNSPYQTLSKSAKYRVGVAFQYALARLTGARILLIDEADILDGIHQTELVNFLLFAVSDFDQILVFATGDMAAAWTADPRAQTGGWKTGKLSRFPGGQMRDIVVKRLRRQVYDKGHHPGPWNTSWATASALKAMPKCLHCCCVADQVRRDYQALKRAYRQRVRP